MDNLFIDFLNTSITASYIIVAVLLVRAIFKKLPKKFICALWAVAGLRLIMPFSIESAFSLIPSAQTVPQDIAMLQTPAIQSGVPAVNDIVNPIISETLAPEVGASVNPIQIINGVVSAVWIIGIAVILVYGAVTYFRLRKTVATAVPLKDNILQSENVVSPFILGFITPRIYIPFGMDDATADYVIAHETAHIRRRDHWIKPIGFLLLAVYWFNPLVWLAYVMLCRDIEIACDEKVIARMDGDERKDYANALFACAVNRRKIAACPLAFGEVGIKERIKGVMNYKKPAFWVIVVAVIACIVTSVCFLTNPESTGDYEYPYRIIAEIRREGSDEIETKVFSAKKGDQHPVIDGIKFTVADVNLQTGEIDLGFDGEIRPISIFSEKPVGLIALNLTQSHRLKTAEGAEITFSFVMIQDLDQAVTKAITEYCKGSYMEGSAEFEAHEILKVERKKNPLKSGSESVTAYMYMAYGEYVYENGKAESVSGCSMPVAITFDYTDGIYVLTEFWQPEDGSYYADSIREKFPVIIAETVIHKDFSVVETADEKARIYFESLDNGCAVNTGVEGFNASVIAMPLYGDNPYVEIEWANGTAYDIECTGTHGMQMFIERSWVNVQTGAIFEPTYLKVIKPGEAYTVKYDLGMFDIEADGLYRFTDVFTINGEDFTARIDFNKGPVKGDADVEVLTTTAVVADDPHFDTSEYNSVISVARGRFVARKIIDQSAYSALLDENGNELIPFFRGEIRRMNGSAESVAILSVEPLDGKDILTDADGKSICEYEFNGTGVNEKYSLVYGYTDDEYVFFDYGGEHLATVKEGETADLKPEQWMGYIITVKNCGNTYKFGVSKNGIQIIPCEYDEIDVVDVDRIVARIGELQGLAPTDILRIFDGRGNQLTTDGDYNYAAFIKNEEYGVASKMDEDYKLTCWLIDQDGKKHSEGYDTIYGTESGYVGERNGEKFKIKP